MSKYNNIEKRQDTALFENLLHGNIIDTTGGNRPPLDRVLPWFQRFFFIFHCMGELRESREAANASSLTQ